MIFGIEIAQVTKSRVVVRARSAVRTLATSAAKSNKPVHPAKHDGGGPRQGQIGRGVADETMGSAPYLYSPQDIAYAIGREFRDSTKPENPGRNG